MSYCAPERIFGNKASKASDIWALACTLYKLRSGQDLFDDFLSHSKRGILRDIIEALGHPPAAQRHLFEEASVKFDDPEMTPEKGHEFKKLVEEIGMNDTDDPEWVEMGGDDWGTRKPPEKVKRWGPMYDPPHTQISKEEAAQFTDLLRKTIVYEPSQRLTAGEMARHPWMVDEGVGEYETDMGWLLAVGQLGLI